MSEQILNLLNIITLVAAATVIVLFLSRIRRGKFYLLLAAFLFTYVSGAIVPLLSRGDIYAHHPFWIYFPVNLNILALPFIYGFLMHLMRVSNWKKIYWPFIIPVISILAQLSCWCLSNDIKLEHLNNGQWDKIYYTFRTISLAHTFFMIFFILKNFNLYQNIVDQYYAVGPAPGFNWIKTLCYFLLIMKIPLAIPPSYYATWALPILAISFSIAGIALILWVGIAGLNHVYLYVENEMPIVTEHDLICPTESHAPDYSEEMTNILDQFQDKQLFRSVTLSLDELATELKISPRRLSRLINQETGMNFRNFVNCFRINYAKEQIHAGVLKKMNMKGLAHDAGFKSKTTFYKAFKLEVGMTPSTYLRINKHKIV